MAVLTADFGGRPEDVGNLRVHGDHEVLLLRPLLVTDLDLELDPVGESVLQHGLADTTDPVFAAAMDLLRIGKVVEDVLVAVREEVGDVLEGQALVLRHGDVLDVLGSHTLLFGRDDVLQEVDGYLLVRRKEDADVHGEEVVHLTLRAVEKKGVSLESRATYRYLAAKSLLLSCSCARPAGICAGLLAAIVVCKFYNKL